MRTPGFGLIAVAVACLLASATLADEKAKDEKKGPAPTAVTVTKVDAKKGEITVKYTDAQGKPLEKTFRLTRDVKILDETGRVATIDVFEAGHEALVVETEGRLREFRRAARFHRGHRLSDAVQTLIEMTEGDDVSAEEVQRIYDILRKLDTAKDGKIDHAALKSARDRILEERVRGVFDRLDADKDGKVSKDEARGLVREHFDHIDANKDGAITFEELVKAARERREAKSTEPEKK
jgi:Ca2+-binding EF-hand superfamily protein